MTGTETADDDYERSRRDHGEEPGVAVVFNDGRPALRVQALEQGALVVGRETSGGLDVVDVKVSRAHASIAFDGQRWTITDLKSHNGTFVDGTRVEGRSSFEGARVVRIGQTLLLLERNVRRLLKSHRIHDGAFVLGPDTRAAMEAIERAARDDLTLLIRGESGTGKEHAARTFHTFSSASKGPFVHVNCAAIPASLAERLLFGTRKGAYSGATADAPGHVQTADGGVLFLDEIAELDLDVQAKLLRFLETKEVHPLGAREPFVVDVRVCAATHRDLRALCAQDRFRADLYYRLARQEVVLPPLRERLEEVPWIIALEVRKERDALTPTARFVESCMLRTWPGNVRELRTEVARAAKQAIVEGESTISADALSPNAGLSLGSGPPPPATKPSSAPSTAPEGASELPSAGDHPMREAILDAMKRHGGNLTAVARSLGIHRTQLYRWMKKLGIDE